MVSVKSRVGSGARGVLAGVAGVALSLTLVTGCTPQPEPVESQDPFPTEEEAFAAAEETYRNYVDALNAVDLSDPETFEPVYEWTTGDLNASDRESFTQWHAEGLTKTGAAAIEEVTLVPMDNHESNELRLEACYNVDAVNVANAAGESLVSPDRPAVQHLQITLVRSAGTVTGLVLSGIDPVSTGTLNC